MAGVSKPCVWTDVPSDAVTFKTAKRQNNGGVRVEIDLDRSQLRGGSNEAGLQKMRIQTPRFRRFRIKRFEDNRSGKISYAGSFTLGDLHGVGVPAKFVQEFVKPLEEKIVQTAASKSLEWFKKNKDVEDLKRVFTSTVKEGGTNQEGVPYGPLMKCKVPFLRGQLECDFFKGDRAAPDAMKGTPSSMKEYEEMTENGAEGVDCVGILEYENVWFMGQSFGVTPILKSLLYWPNDSLKGFSFVDESTPASAMERGPADAFLDGPVAKRQKAAPADDDAGKAETAA